MPASFFYARTSRKKEKREGKTKEKGHKEIK
jgi:hypothetical protein